jgi:hypothetical protein
MVELCTQLATERASLETLRLPLIALGIYPNPCSGR